MKSISIQSYLELQEKLKVHPNAFLLIYKSGSKVSECALNNIEKALDENTFVYTADVKYVKDVHPKFEITTAPVLLSFDEGLFINAFKGCNEVQFYSSVFERNLYVAKNKGDKEKPQKRVTVYSTPNCSWCTTLKNHLKIHAIKYSDIDVSKDQEASEAMVKRSGQQGVPQTDIGGQMIVGFDKNKINSLLGIGA
ncbi:MAG: glutaredoxin domain-containing protein [Bacteroidales bacterium]|jgi:glutaredoxin-like YruB-family protein|nr:glutaredoxin domain-containing protein [Bacteroidales bacterium]